jgi:hypothetical protein
VASNFLIDGLARSPTADGGKRQAGRLRGLVPVAAIHQMPDVDRAPRDSFGPRDVTGDPARMAWADRRRERPPPSATSRFGDLVLDAPVQRVLLHARQTRSTDAKFRMNAALCGAAVWG